MVPMTSAPEPSSDQTVPEPAPAGQREPEPRPDLPVPPELSEHPELSEQPELSDDSAGLLGGAALRPVSPALIKARYVAGILGYVIGLLLVIGAIVGAVLSGWWWIGLLGLIPFALVAQGLLLTPRRVRALGYRDAEEDLTIATGIMFRTVRTIPYGRVQSVKIDEGPVDRRYGLAKITVSTANGSPVTLPGLPKQEAERLRTLLTERGIETMAAL